MARKVVWAQESVKDLESIADYIARDSHYSGQKRFGEINDAVKTFCMPRKPEKSAFCHFFKNPYPDYC